MSDIWIHGYGVVSPAGWGVDCFRSALASGEPLPTQELASPAVGHVRRVRSVPAPPKRPAFMAHARLRRTSPISHFAAAASLEALGVEIAESSGEPDLGIVYCVMCGCVNHSRRFYDEVLKDPRTASPLLFPETVFNAPASHLACLLGVTGATTTVVGDNGAFLQGLALGASWVISGRVKRCLVVGAEEVDWLTAEAARLFDPQTVLSGGAGAVLLGREDTSARRTRLIGITTPVLFTPGVKRAEAGRRMREELRTSPEDLLCDGVAGRGRSDRPELEVWRDWTGQRISVKRLLGEGLVAGAAWQCVAAVDGVSRGVATGAVVSVMDGNEQAIAARFGV